MAALIALALASAGVTVPRPGADLVGRWAVFIREAADRTATPESWIRRVMRAESAGRTMLAGQPITSRAGAMGVMQLMPATWAEMRARLHLGSDPFDAHDNILAGAAFLRLMYDRFGYPGLFGAYNAGPARYAAYLKGTALPAETVGYLTKVTGGAGASSEQMAAPGAMMFVAVDREAGQGPQRPPAARSLFAIRHEAVTQHVPMALPDGGKVLSISSP